MVTLKNLCRHGELKRHGEFGLGRWTVRRETVGLRVQLQELDDLRVAMPETAAFLQAGLSRDPTKDLDVA